MATAQASFAERMRETVELSEERSALVKQTYVLLSLAVAAAITGAYIGATTTWIVNLFLSFWGWILAIVLINVIPNIAIKMRHNPGLGVLALAANGFVGGLVLGPAIYVAGLFATGTSILANALILTGVVFASVTAIVWTSGKRYSAPRGLMMGIFIGLIAAVSLNFIFPIGFFGILISLGIGVFGVLTLVYSTSDILHDPDIDSPIIGAVMLFAGLFMIFQAILHLLMAFAGGDE